MQCPTCNLGIRLTEQGRKAWSLPNKLGGNGNIKRLGVEIIFGVCPDCETPILLAREGEFRVVDGEGEIDNPANEQVLYPRLAHKCSDDRIPALYRDAFNEAYTVASISPKSSAALSRRLLQTLLREECGIKPGDLDAEIQEFLSKENLPQTIARSVDAIRVIGNFSAHPNKYKNTGEIVDVEDGEADWLLEVLELLFDMIFIAPKIAEAREDKLNQKLSKLGKPLLKG